MTTETFRRKCRERMMGNTYRRGKKMPESAKQKISAGLIGNSYRRGIPHTAEIKAQIGASVRRAFEEGRHAPSAPTFAKFQERIARGEVPSPWVKATRNDIMVQLREAGATYTEIARRFRLDPSGCRKTVLSHIARKGAAAQ
jgi:hypothetical protein